MQNLKAARGFWRIVTAVFVVSVTLSSVSAQKNDRDLVDLGRWMTGSFDTFKQVDADEDADTKYRHIRALLHVVPIKVAGIDGSQMFYVENQAAESRTKPYRQRIYLLSRVDGKVVLEVFRIKDDASLINAYKFPERLATITRDRLTKEEGCDLTYDRTDKTTFKGSNFGNKNCKSTLRGATHTNSESVITPTEWTNLDQGFDDSGIHKWGPPPGIVGHIFVKRK